MTSSFRVIYRPAGCIEHSRTPKKRTMTKNFSFKPSVIVWTRKFPNARKLTSLCNYRSDQTSIYQIQKSEKVKENL